MHLFMFVFVAALFFVLTPGVVLTLPPKGSKMVVAFVHAIVFSIVWTLIHHNVWEWAVANNWVTPQYRREGMTMNMCRAKNGNYKSGYCYDSQGNLIQS